jgi:hypothetical protein
VIQRSSSETDRVQDTQTRRRFLGILPGALLAVAAGARSAMADSATHCGPVTHGRGAFAHPDPRPGIDASKVLTADRLANPSAAPVYDMVREIPEIVDGIRCHCGCAELDGYYSLLTCYEEQGMAQFCDICKGQAREAYRLHEKGKELKAIRTAIDARFA